MDRSNESTLVCIGKFDHNGFPQITSPHFSQQATVVLQTIALAPMVAQLIGNETLQSARMRHTDGSVIRIERDAQGFTAYLE